MNVNWQKGDQRQITVRVADVVNGLPIFNSSTAQDGSSRRWLAAVKRLEPKNGSPTCCVKSTKR